MAVDALQHQDGVVHQDADRQGQRQHRHLVQAEAGEVHRHEGDDDRRRNLQGDDEGVLQAVQEDKDHQHGQERSQDEGDVHVVERVPDGNRVVLERSDAHVRRKGPAQVVQLLVDVVGYLNGVGVGQAGQNQADAFASAHARDLGACRDGVHHLRDLGQEQGRPGERGFPGNDRSDGRQPDVGDLAQVVELRRHTHADFGVAHRDVAGGRALGSGGDDGAQAQKRQAGQIEAVRIDADLHLALVASDHLYAGDTGRLAQSGFDLLVDQFPQFLQRPLPGDAQHQHRPGVHVHLADDGALDFVRQVGSAGVQTGPHLRRRGVQIDAQLKANRDERDVLLRDGVGAGDVGDAADGVLNGPADPLFDLVRTGPGIDRHHVDNGNIHGRVHLRRHEGASAQTEEGQRRHRHDEDDGSVDGEPSKPHGLFASPHRHGLARFQTLESRDDDQFSLGQTIQDLSVDVVLKAHGD